MPARPSPPNDPEDDPMTNRFKLGLVFGLPLGVALYFAIVWLLPKLGEFNYIFT
jgi:hypothetical protein